MLIRISKIERKITPEQVYEIKERLYNEEPVIDIANAYGVSRELIKQIATGRIYKNVVFDKEIPSRSKNLSPYIVAQIYKEYSKYKDKIDLKNDSQRLNLVNALSKKYEVGPKIVWEIISGKGYSNITNAERFDVTTPRNKGEYPRIIQELSQKDPSERFDWVKNYAAQTDQPWEPIANRVRSITNKQGYPEFMPLQKKMSPHLIDKNTIQQVYDSYRQTHRVGTTAQELGLTYSQVEGIINGTHRDILRYPDKNPPRISVGLAEQIREGHENGKSPLQLAHEHGLLRREVEDILQGHIPKFRRTKKKEEEELPQAASVAEPDDKDNLIAELYRKLVPDQPTDKIRFDRVLPGNVSDYLGNASY